MNRRCLIVAGVGLRGDGYPNAANTVALLQSSGSWEVCDQARWLPPDIRLWHLVRGPFLRRISLVFRLIVGGVKQAAGLLGSAGRNGLVYLPYPAPITLWWLSFVPARWRPCCVADAYISLWDSMFRDRRAGKRGGIVSRLVHGFERRSLNAAVLVLVDTEANERQLAADFSLPASRVMSIPLAIQQEALLSDKHACTRAAISERLRVLFVGTLVPLHGIEVVLAAIEQLAAEKGIEFRLIGDGQQGPLVENFIREHAYDNLTWVREWQSLDDIAREIARADVCLGVFGGAEKAARVLPFKLYYALAVGKLIVTQAEYSLPKGLPPLPIIPVAGDSPEVRARGLADALRELMSDRTRIPLFGAMAAGYFQQNLSGGAVVRAWERQIAARPIVRS